jgi:hypothetical protein
MGVERLHVHPHLRPYSVGQHTADLAALVTLCWMHDHYGLLPRSELIVATIFHDVPEGYTGDVPGPLKEALGAAKLDEMEMEVWRFLGLSHRCFSTGVLTDVEKAYLHHCDRFELWLWSWEEAARGNIFFSRWLDSDYFTRGPAPYPPSLTKLREAVMDHVGITPLDVMDIRKLLEENNA